MAEHEIYFWACTENAGWFAAKGESVTIHGLPCVVHRALGAKAGFTVSDLSTGASFGQYRRSKESAIAAAVAVSKDRVTLRAELSKAVASDEYKKIGPRPLRRARVDAD
jgi:hypothetical protein